jgi:hypothetical protein
VDLGANAYPNGAMSQPLQAGLRQILQQVANQPNTVRLTFHVPQNASAADVTNARALMDVTENYVRRIWRDVGRARLRVEHVIIRAGE